MAVNPKDMTDEDLEAATREKCARSAARVREAQIARNRTRQLALDVVLAGLHARYGVSGEAAEDIWSELESFYEEWDR